MEKRVLLRVLGVACVLAVACVISGIGCTPGKQSSGDIAESLADRLGFEPSQKHEGVAPAGSSDAESPQINGELGVSSVLISGSDFFVTIKIQPPFVQQTVTGAIVTVDGTKNYLTVQQTPDQGAVEDTLLLKGHFNGGPECSAADPKCIYSLSGNANIMIALYKTYDGPNSMKVGLYKAWSPVLQPAPVANATTQELQQGLEVRGGMVGSGAMPADSGGQGKPEVPHPGVITVPTLIGLDVEFKVTVDYTSQVKVKKLFVQLKDAKSYIAYNVNGDVGTGTLEFLAKFSSKMVPPSPTPNDGGVIAKSVVIKDQPPPPALVVSLMGENNQVGETATKDLEFEQKKDVCEGPGCNPVMDGGLDTGYDAGVDTGYDAGFDAGLDAGYDAGEDAGYDAGFDAGTDGGYSCGNLGESCCTEPIATLLRNLMTGGVCNMDLACNPDSGKCEPCGDDGELCCGSADLVYCNYPIQGCSDDGRCHKEEQDAGYDAGTADAGTTCGHKDGVCCHPEDGGIDDAGVDGGIGLPGVIENPTYDGYCVEQGLVCNQPSDICEPCGDFDQLCCLADGSFACNGVLVCGTGGRCEQPPAPDGGMGDGGSTDAGPTCGMEKGDPCCISAKFAFDLTSEVLFDPCPAQGLLCDDGVCQHCGETEELCCDPNLKYYSCIVMGTRCALDEELGRNTCALCGGADQNCCAGDLPCGSPEYLTCDYSMGEFGICSWCGGVEGSPCCNEGPACKNWGLTCISNPTTPYCVTCGFDSESCCYPYDHQGDINYAFCSDAYTECIKNDQDPDYGLCRGCGQADQKCCGGIDCAAGFVCQDGWCMDNCTYQPTGFGGPMCMIPGGTYPVGCSTDPLSPGYDPDCDFMPHTEYTQVNLEPYYLDKDEVTAGEYRVCILTSDGGCGYNLDGGSGCNAPSYDNDYRPMNCVTLEMAESYCRWAGKALPAGNNWEAAARGPAGYKYPWGDQPVPDCSRAVMSEMTDGGYRPGCGLNIPWLVYNLQPEGKGPFGNMGMVGNIDERVGDMYLNQNAVRGGNYLSADTRNLSAVGFIYHTPVEQNATLGFRCAYVPVDGGVEVDGGGATCGEQGLPCCEQGAGVTGGPTYYCNGTRTICNTGHYCEHCGLTDEPCCTTGAQCDGVLQCDNQATPTCQPCGGSGEQCCAVDGGYSCNPGMWCDPGVHQCMPPE